VLLVDAAVLVAAAVCAALVELQAVRQGPLCCSFKYLQSQLTVPLVSLLHAVGTCSRHMPCHPQQGSDTLSDLYVWCVAAAACATVVTLASPQTFPCASNTCTVICYYCSRRVCRPGGAASPPIRTHAAPATPACPPTRAVKWGRTCAHLRPQHASQISAEESTAAAALVSVTLNSCPQQFAALHLQNVTPAVLLSIGAEENKAAAALVGVVGNTRIGPICRFASVQCAKCSAKFAARATL
jgi:hypothetical protein